MIQFELDHALDSHRHWLRDKRFGARADFSDLTLENLDITYKDLSGAIFNNACIFSCNLSNSNFTNIMATRVHFMDCDFTNANFKNAHLQQARYALNKFSNTDLWNVSGDGVYIISLQLGGSYVCYTSELLQINCLQFDIEKIWWMSEDDIFANVGEHSDEELVNMRAWWTKWRQQIYHIVNFNPAKPVNSPK